MKNFASFCKKHWISIAGAAIVFLILAIGYFGCQSNELQDAIINNQTGAKGAVREAANASAAAANASIERQVEDGLRNKIITPKLDHARRKSQNSKAALEAARKTHNEKKTDTSNLPRSHADNCRELAGLFPDVRFEDCQ